MRFKYYLRGAGIGVIAATLILSVAFLFHDNISDEEVIRRALKLGMVMQENTPGTLADQPQSGASSVDLETGADPEGSTQADADPLADPSGEPSDAGQAADPDTAAGNSQPSGSDSGTDKSGDTDSGISQPSDPEEDGKEAGNAGQASDGKADEQAGDSSKEPSNGQQADHKSDNRSDDKKEQASNDEKEDNRKEESDEVEIVIASGDVSRMVSAKVFEAGLVDDADEFNSFLGSNDYDNMLQPGTYKIKKGSSFRQIAKILTRQ